MVKYDVMREYDNMRTEFDERQDHYKLKCLDDALVVICNYAINGPTPDRTDPEYNITVTRIDVALFNDIPDLPCARLGLDLLIEYNYAVFESERKIARLSPKGLILIKAITAKMVVTGGIR